MLNERRRAAGKVAEDFLKAEMAADQAAMLAAACMTTMLQQRVEAGLPVGTGMEALQLVSEAASDLVKARHRLVEAHAKLVDVRAGIGLRMFGDEAKCPPTEGALAPVQLAAVA